MGAFPVFGRGLRGAPPQAKVCGAGIVPGGRHQFSESVCRRGGIAPREQRFGPDRANIIERRQIGRRLPTLRRGEGEKAIGRRDRLGAPAGRQQDRRLERQARRRGGIVGMIGDQSCQEREPLVASAGEIDEPLGSRQLQAGDEAVSDRFAAGGAARGPQRKHFVCQGDGVVGATGSKMHPR